MRKHTLALLTVLTLIGGLLRFYNLNWDGPYFFHPDERNIAGAVLNLDFAAGDFNPNFFAYGSLPIYAVRAVIEVTGGDLLNQAILVSRLISALLSTLLIPLVFVVTSTILSSEGEEGKEEPEKQPLSFVAALLTAFAPGLIQFAHFGTFEVWLAFEYLLVLLFALRVARRGQWRDYIGLSVALAMALATKVVSLALLPILPLAHLLRSRKRHLDPKGLVRLLGSGILVLVVTFLFAPYQVFDFGNFRESVNYESSVARGTLDVFYTQQFIDTTPVAYQLARVFPYILGWPLTILSVAALVYLSVHLLRKSQLSIVNRQLFHQRKDLRLTDASAILLLAVTTLYALPHLTFFVKWTRYMVPILPLLTILSVVLFLHLFKWIRPLGGNVKCQMSNACLAGRRVKCFLIGGLLLLTVSWTILQGLNFFGIYLQPDPRIEAAEWASQNIPPDAKILSEVYDLGILPWNAKFPVRNITLYNVYNVDDPHATENLDELYRLASDSDYIVLPSSRIWDTRLRLCDQFPSGCQFYHELFDGSLGYKLTAEFSRPTWSGLTKNSSWFLPDETFHIFDNPTVLVFRNIQRQ